MKQFFPSRKFRRLPLLGQFLRCLPGNLFLRGNGRHSCCTVGLSLLSQTGGHPLLEELHLQKHLCPRRRGSNSSSPITPSHFWPNWCGCPPVGRSVFSTQYWRVWAYATVFSLCISLMSWQAKIESGGSWKILLRRHNGAGGPDSSSPFCLPHWLFQGD